MKEKPDCKTCAYALLLFQRVKSSKLTEEYSPTGYARCSGPRYKGRAFFVKDNKTACSDYLKKARGK